jgi:putative DeoR family transcriptional regulator (stage III sporulation protein D)
MADTIDQRACELAVYMIETGATVRNAAGKFGISKSTVHKDVTVRLREEAPDLYSQVKIVLEKNKQERHIRGGMATKEKYLLKSGVK